MNILNNSQKPVLLVLAAGMGSRYGGGGLKQIDPLGPNGEILIDYSLFDARAAGFETVVFVIKPDMEQVFRDTIGKRASEKMEVRYAFQSVDNLPPSCTVPEGRTKPWGTGHAVWCAKDVIHEPFGIIHADDFYGADCFKRLYDFLIAPKTPMCMVAFPLKNTLSENGSVSRGICLVRDGLLASVTERTNIVRGQDGVIYYDDNGALCPLPEDSVASMSVWGMPANTFEQLERGFVRFFGESGGDALKREYYTPFFVDELVQTGKTSVTVLETNSTWYGVTHQADKGHVMSALKKMHENGLYPNPK